MLEFNPLRWTRLVSAFRCVALLSAVSGCATTVQVNARFPAQYPAASELRRVAVADFYGPEGDRFAYGFEAMLGSAQFDGAPYFSLVDSGHRGAGAETLAAVNYGRSVGAQGVFFGQIQSADMHNDRYQNEESRCKEKGDKDHKDKCTKWETVKIPCVHRVFEMYVIPTMVKVSNGKVVYSSRKSASADTRWCKDSDHSMSDDALIDSAQDQILASIRTDVAPYNRTMQATVSENHDGLAEEPAKQFDAAVAAAKKGDIGEACRLWGDVRRTSPTHPWTVYDLGVCAESISDFRGALALYRQARTLAPKADSDIAEAIARAQQLAEANDALAHQKGRGSH